MDGFPLLTAIIVLPAIGAVVTALLPRSRPELVRPVAVSFTVGTLALTVSLLASFESGEAGFQFTTFHSWIEQWGIAWNLGVDGISLFLVVLTGVLFPLSLLGADPHHDAKPYMAWLLLLEAGLMGSFLSLDLFFFFVFFEIVLVPMYFLIGGWGYAQRVYAALKFFLFTMTGSAFMLVGILSTVFLYAQQNGGRLTFDLVELARERRLRHHHRPLAVRVLRHRVRGEGPDLPAAHVVAPRPHAGADGGVGHPGRGDAEARHVRVAPLRALPLPRSGGVVRARAADAGRDRDPLRRGRRHHAEGPQAAHRLLLGGPPRVHRARHVRAAPSSRSPVACSR